MLLEPKEMIQNMKKNTKMSFIASFLILLFAVILLKNPENFLNVAINVFGYGAIFIGVLLIVFYFRLKEDQRYLNQRLLNGILCIAFGAVAFFVSDLLKDMTTFLLGGYFIYQNASRIQLITSFKKYFSNTWLYLCIISLINIIISFFLMVPFIISNLYISILIIAVQILYVIQSILFLIFLKEENASSKAIIKQK